MEKTQFLQSMILESKKKKKAAPAPKADEKASRASKSAKALKKLLSDNGITQVHFAEKMGMNKPEINGRYIVLRWLNGTTRPTRATRAHIEIITDGKIKAADWEKI